MQQFRLNSLAFSAKNAAMKRLRNALWITLKTVTVLVLLRWKDSIKMNENNQIVKSFECEVIAEPVIPEVDNLARYGFTSEEIVALVWLRQWYQNGGSDRAEIMRHLEFLKLLVQNGKLAL